MKNVSLVFVAALSIAAVGCKKSGGDCDAAVGHSMEIMKSMMPKMDGMPADWVDKAKALGVQHCKEDGWGDDALKCMTEATAMADSQACYKKLTQEQQDKMNKARKEMMTGMMGGMGGGMHGPHGGGEPAAAAPAAGSDTAAPAAPAGGGSAAAGGW